MGLRQDHEKLTTIYKAAKYNFIATELDLALTFCTVALGSDDKAKSRRNAEHAQRAYDSATHFLVDAGFSTELKSTLQEKVVRLRTILRQLNGRRKKVVPEPTTGSV